MGSSGEEHTILHLGQKLRVCKMKGNDENITEKNTQMEIEEIHFNSYRTNGLLILLTLREKLTNKVKDAKLT